MKRAWKALCILLAILFTAGCAEIPVPDTVMPPPTPEPAPVLAELSAEQKQALTGQLQAFAEVAYDKPFLSSGVHAPEELFAVERASLYYVYTMVTNLFYDAWEPYGWEWSDRANAFRDAFGTDCYLEDNLAYIPEDTIRSAVEGLYGGDISINWGGMFQNGYYAYEEYDSDFFLTLQESGETDWSDSKEILFPYEYDDYGEMYYGSIRFTLTPDDASPYGRIVTGFAFDKQTEAPLPVLEGSWIYWGTMTGWEDEKYLKSPIPEEALGTDGRGHFALEIDGDAGAYRMEFYSQMMNMTEAGNGEYRVDDPAFGSFTLVDANTLHYAIHGDIEVYKRNDPYPDINTGGSMGTAAGYGGLVNGRLLPMVSSYLYSEAELLQKAQTFVGSFGGSVPEALRIARNECYANYGNVFQDEKLNQYFYVTQGAWFQPRPEMTSEMINSLFNGYEQANIKAIQALEERFQ